MNKSKKARASSKRGTAAPSAAKRGRKGKGIAARRAAIAALDAQLIANANKLAQAEAARTRAARAGGSPAQLQQFDTRIQKLRDKQKLLARRLVKQKRALAELTEKLAAAATPEQRVETLDGGVPVLLLPVRIETRFFNNGNELRIRIYPDQAHLNGHEPELTDSERRGGEWYWEQRWQDPSAEVGRGAWRALVKAFGPWRASWIVRALTPTNLSELGTAAPPQFPPVAAKADSWTRAIQATALPDRWVAIGYQATEVFRKWSAAVPDTLAVSLTPDPADVAPPPAENELPIDDGMRWTVDYERALAQGMAITVTSADLIPGHPLSRGLTRLVVLGVDSTLNPNQSAAAVAALLEAHQYSDGLAFLEPGTPTNNTGSARSGLNESADQLAEQLDPDSTNTGGADTSASQLLVRALGLPAKRVHLDRAPGATLSEQRTASHLLNALWTSTLGYYLDELCNPEGDAADQNPILDDATLDQVREHVESYLQPGGPLPALRIGKQPYGVLPVVAPGFKPAPNDGFSGRLFAVLNLLRPFWAGGVSKVPRIGTATSSDELDETLLKILQMTPLASVARFRRVFGAATAANTQGLKQYEAIQGDLLAQIIAPHLNLPKPPRIMEFVTDPRSYNLPVPWVQVNGVSETEPLQPNYITDIAATLRGKNGSDARAVLSAQEDADSLLEALLAHAAVKEIDHSANRLVNLHNKNVGRITEPAARSAALRVPEMLHAAKPAPRQKTPGVQTAQVYSPLEMSRVILPTVTNNLTVAEHITEAIQRPALLRKPELVNLASFLASLDALESVPSAELERAFRGLLDAYSHRLDAWYTSLAARCLNQVRSARPVGLHVGGYGWVENLRRDVQPESLGYVHAPSIPQAITAAVLRSGHLSHQTGESTGGQTPLNIDLSSRRVRLALDVIYGVAQGQPLAALLGYRFERSLRERDLRLARFILPFRLVAPLRPNDEALPPGQSVESIAARDVVDGVALLDMWRKSGAALLDQPPIAAQTPTEDDKNQIADELYRLADVLDAASDVLLAESLYQTVLGNYERAGAALAALDRQERPVEPAVVRTPRTGKAYVQRVMVLLDAAGLLPGWAALDDPRAQAEPRVNAWVGSLLGNPKRVRLAARVLRERTDGSPPDEIRRIAARVDVLGLAPLSLVFAAAPGGWDKPSELEERLAMHFASHVPDGDEHTFIELLETAPANAPPGSIGLGELRALLDWIRALVSERRAADARDLALPAELPGDGIDAAEVAARASTLKTTLAQVISDLQSASTAPTLRAALMRAAALNAPNALPRTHLNDAEAVSQLKAQAQEARAHLERAQAEIARVDARMEGKTLNAFEEAQHHASTIKIVFGKAFPVLPTFMPVNSAELGATLKDQQALNHNDALAPIGWLRKMGLVHPGVAALGRVLSGAALLGSTIGGAANCALMQLPHQPGQRWLALSFADGAAPAGDLAIFAHTPAKLDVTKPLAGFVCDEWVEVIPNASETTAVSFHYDAPGARPPQVMILAVPPEPDMTNWNLQALLDTVNETFALGQLRAVGPKEMDVLTGLVPAVYLPNNFTRDVPSLDLFQLRAKHLSSVVAEGVLGKDFLKGS